MEREHDLFETTYHHVTFTVPMELRGLFKANKKALYRLLFESMWATLYSFSKDPRSRLQADIGVISILHTWTQKLEYHPHLHCIVPAGGLTSDGRWKTTSEKFLFSVKALSIVFKSKFSQGLKDLFIRNKLNTDLNEGYFDDFIALIKRKKWVINSKPGFNGKASVLEYLGRYTHKIAISNYRLLKLSDGMVTFSYRDRRAGDIKKVMSLPVREFIYRFSQHILPRGFVKIRHYGLFATRVKEKKLKLVRESLKQVDPQPKEKLSIEEVIKRTTGVDILLCEHCKEGTMKTVRVIPAARGSPRKFPVKTQWITS